MQKYIIASTLLGLTIILELSYDKLGIPKMVAGIGSFVKISLIPLLFIGFLLGMKYSFLFCMIYACFHLVKAIYFNHFIDFMRSVGFTNNQILGSVFLDYVLVDLSYSLSGLLFYPRLQYFDNKRKIWTTLLIIFTSAFIFKFLSSLLIWFVSIETKTSWHSFLNPLLKYPNIWCAVYNLIPVAANLLLTGCLFSFLNPRIKVYLKHK
ncbi:hypothetical protein ['Fragaria x ananassa' phyllody phytoplasma]|uniref:hypothetical protein n=1 Tax='Fragaria x ananassa' phyllody phytoplasma TaxID=2358428 RepID=UPI001CEDE0CE|nr:hypothetical protein ['Fragaria x ananassa' phyllody phytoplasma]